MSLLAQQLSRFAEFFERDDVTEIVVNRPGCFQVEGNDGFEDFEAGWLTADWLADLAAKLKAPDGSIATARDPLLSGTLPSGARVHLVRPPAIPREDVAAVTIRLPARKRLDHGDLVALGLYERAPEWAARLPASVKARRRIVISGATGSGKTSLLAALADFIDVRDRVLTVENVRELHLPLHANRVHLLHDEERAGGVTAGQLVQAAMRMRPDWLVMGEIRSGVALDYFEAVTAGIEGSMATTHASQAGTVPDRLLMLFQKSKAGASLGTDTALRLILSGIDLIVQLAQVPDPGNARRRLRRVVEVLEMNLGGAQ